jgi:hypothetical protein
MRVIIYYIPFSVLTRSSLNIEIVKGIYYLKIESKDDNVYKFIESIRNKKLQIVDNNYRGDLRAVIEFYYDDEMIFSYALNMFHIVINGNGLQYERQFYEFLALYLPKRYEYDFEYFLK